MKSRRGVVIYVKDIISAERRDNLSDSNFLESVWVDVNINKQDKILIGGIYRSPIFEHDNTQILFDLLNSACLSFFLLFLYITTLKDFYKFTFFHRTIIHWNALPHHITTLPTLAQFSTAVCQVAHSTP